MNDSDGVEVLEIPSVHILEGEKMAIPPVAGQDWNMMDDPRYPDEPDRWTVHILEGEWKDWVVAFPEIYLENGKIDFTYEIIFSPEIPKGYSVDAYEIGNYMSSIIEDILGELHKETGTLEYVDVETGEKIDL